MNAHKTKPDFIVIGAQKAGTSTIYETLKALPGVEMPDQSELEFFSMENRYKCGLSFYARHFQSVGHDKLCGEVSPGYMVQPEVAIRIRRSVPDVRLIAVLRDPIERAFSAWLMQVSKGSEILPFHEAVQKTPVYLQHSRYFKNLRPFFELFDREDILVVQFDELKQAPKDFFLRICKFLGVSDPPLGGQIKRANDGGLPKHILVTKGLNLAYRCKGRLLESALRPAIEHRLIDGTTRRVRNMVAAWNRDTTKRSSVVISQEAREYLLAELSEDVSRLEDLLGNDLSHWLQEE